MPAQPHVQAKPSLELNPEKRTDSSRYTAPSVRKSDRLTAITGVPKVTSGG